MSRIKETLEAQKTELRMLTQTKSRRVICCLGSQKCKQEVLCCAVLCWIWSWPQTDLLSCPSCPVLSDDASTFAVRAGEEGNCKGYIRRQGTCSGVGT